MKKYASFAIIALVSLSLVGCFNFPFNGAVVPQSHFDYPNSNVSPLGNAQGSSSGVIAVLGLIPIKDPDALCKEAIDDAIQAKGGDMLIDYTMSGSTTVWLYGLVISSQISVKGTAAKMDIGKKKLSE